MIRSFGSCFLGVAIYAALIGVTHAQTSSQTLAADELVGWDEHRRSQWMKSASWKTLAELYPKLRTRPIIAAQVALRLARIARHRRRYGQARVWAKQATQGDESRQRAAELLIRDLDLRDTCIAGRLGILLPLTGTFGSVGQEALSGLRLGLQNRPGIDLRIGDTQGSRAGAMEAFRALVEDARVCVILGPVGHQESAIAAQLADEAEIPMITLSSRPALAAASTFVFRYRLGYEESAEAIAEYAMESLGIRRFAILTPRSTYGYGMRNAFWTAVVRRGGTVRAARSYSTKDTRFDDAIRGLIGRLHIDDLPIDLHWRRLNRKIKRKALHVPPQVDFEGLFIPDSGGRIELILPFLSYWDIELRGDPNASSDTLVQKYGGDTPPLVTLLGGASFLTGAAVDLPRQSPGAHFVDAYWRDTDSGRAFEDAWRRENSSPPSKLAAFAFAVGRLASRLAVSNTRRSEVRRELFRLNQFHSIFGRTRIDSSGRIVIEPRILAVDGVKGIQPVTRPTRPVPP